MSDPKIYTKADVEALIAVALAAQEAAHQFRSWLAIETAPVNIRILVALKNKTERIASLIDPPGGYRKHWKADGIYSLRPTHWQPLPEPPK